MRAVCLLFLAACGGKSNEQPLDASSDGSIVDAGVRMIDAKVQDTGIEDTSPPPECKPQDVSKFMPVWKPPTAIHQNKCSAAFIDQVWQDCLSPNATPQTCDKWYGMSSDMAHQQCVECLFTPETSMKLGPLYTFDKTEDINYAGCLAALDPMAIGCAQAIQAAQQCTEAACLPVCPIEDIPTYQAYEKCVSSAQTGVCQQWQQKLGCSTGLMGPEKQCFAGNDWHESYTIIANIFCGP